MSFEEFKAIPGVRAMLEDVLTSTVNSTFDPSLPLGSPYDIGVGNDFDRDTASNTSEVTSESSLFSFENMTSWKNVFNSTIDLLRGLGLVRQERGNAHVDDMELVVDSDPHDVAEPSSPWETTFMLESPSSSSSLSSSASSSQDSADTLSSSIATSVSSTSSFHSAVSELSKIVPLSSAHYMDEDEDGIGVVESDSDITPSNPITDPINETASPSNSFNYDRWTPLFQCDRCSQSSIAATGVLEHTCIGYFERGPEETWSMSSFKLDQPFAPRADAVIDEMHAEAEAEGVRGGSGEFEPEEDILRISFGRGGSRNGRDVRKGKGKQGYYGKYRSVSVVRKSSKAAYCQTCPSTVLLEGAEELVSLVWFLGRWSYDLVAL